MTSKIYKPDNSPFNHDLSTPARIMEAAREEFSLHGLEGARVDRIAHRAVVNKAMIYYHFTSKENLYREVIRSFFAEAGARFKEKLDPAEPIDEVLNELADVYLELFTKLAPVRSIMLRELANPQGELLDMIADILSASGLPAILQDKLARGVSEGTIRRVNPRQAALSFIVLNVGYALVAPIADRLLNIDDSQSFFAERKQAVVDLFLNGVKARNT